MQCSRNKTHTKERSCALAPARCLCRAVPAPRPWPALAPVQEFRIISDRFQLPQQGTALLLSSCSHIWKVLGQGVSVRAGMCSPRSGCCPAQALGLGGAFVAAVGLMGRNGPRDPQELISAGGSCCGQGCSAGSGMLCCDQGCSSGVRDALLDQGCSAVVRGALLGQECSVWSSALLPAGRQ